MYSVTVYKLLSAGVHTPVATDTPSDIVVHLLSVYLNNDAVPVTTDDTIGAGQTKSGLVPGIEPGGGAVFAGCVFEGAGRDAGAAGASSHGALVVGEEEQG